MRDDQNTERTRNKTRDEAITAKDTVQKKSGGKRERARQRDTDTRTDTHREREREGERGREREGAERNSIDQNILREGWARSMRQSARYTASVSIPTNSSSQLDASIIPCVTSLPATIEVNQKKSH